MLTHEEMVKKMLDEPAVKEEYDAQAEEFAFLDELLRARQRAGLTQAEVAARMGTKTPAVARLEAGGGSQRHSPSIATLRQVREGCRLSTGGSIAVAWRAIGRFLTMTAWSPSSRTSRRRSETRHAHSTPAIRSNSASSITAMPRARAFSSLLPASSPART